MNIPINDFLFLVTLIIFLILVYQRIIKGKELFEPFKKYYSGFDRNTKKKNYIKEVSKKPLDSQKAIMKEASILLTVLFIMFLLGTKAIFFTAVVSSSMYPTFDRNDLVLMQNIDRSYKAGDIIMFIDPFTERPYTHRITGFSNRGMYTAGDKSGMSDPWDIKEKDILGKAIIIQGKPIVIKGYGRFFIIDDKNQDFGVFGPDYRKYVLFFQVVKIYGYVIAIFSLFIYILLTAKNKSWQNR